ncbi:hypothetical protein AVEN_53846-1 [Araneus ventricosus]|uniref:SOCS box domain-containing protein n=1 Tax=Araneus ventricosus TaxID=182803 RepID=A0A4Y2RFH2_ARAVE|nr:hypothetical protein AVEN_53846-1 [Araneus ventricosus]
MMQIISVYFGTRLYGNSEAASEALRLIWCSVPDACITFEELKKILGNAFSEEKLMDIHGFYVRAIGEFHEFIEPRPLTHLCRTVLRRTFEKNDLWIPDGICRTGLPKSLQSFLNLEKQFTV